MKKPQAKPPTQPELTDFQKEYAAIQKRQKEKILILDAAQALPNVSPSAKQPDGGKKPQERKLTMAEKVAKNVVAQGLPVDKDKKDFEARQAQEQIQLLENQRKSMVQIAKYEQDVAVFKQREARNMADIAASREQNQLLESTLTNLVRDEMDAKELLKGKKTD